ncbi:MAG: hypothetical protein Q9219_003648 [cf. Caloplaca sp. 3 TL-2023]
MQHQEDDCLTPQQSTTILLQYPSVRVHGTPDSWLSNSLLVPMASNVDEGSVRSNDDTISSLGDSAYDFIDDNSIAATDDEDLSRITDSGSGMGQNNLQDSGDSDLERTLSADNLQSHSTSCSDQENVPNSARSRTLEQEENGSDDFSNMQHQNADRQSPLHKSNIRFGEIRHGEGTYVLKKPSTSQCLAVIVKQHMLDQTLSLEGPYRVLYVGALAARERVITKIGAALASTVKLEAPGPSRYNVVPMPSSDDPTCWGEPVLLDWSGHEILVHHCVDASFSHAYSSQPSISLTMEDSTTVKSSWDGSRFSVAGDWEIPDVAIFYISDQCNLTSRETRRCARSFMARHKIPSIIISENPTWGRFFEPMAIDRLTPHICLQTNNDTTSPPGVVKRLPIDISTFSRLDALQLNQNLAYLDKTSSTRQAKYQNPLDPSCQRTVGDEKYDFSNSYLSTLTPLAIRECFGIQSPVFRRVIAWAATLAYFVIISFLISQLPSNPTDSRFTQNVANPYSASDSASLTASWPAVTSTIASQDKSTIMKSSTVSVLTKADTPHCTTGGKLSTDLATLWLESSPKASNKSEEFRAHVLGNAHLILRPPHWFTTLKKPPKLMFNITQGGRVIRHEVSALFDGVYALGLPEDNTRGLVNISIWTNSKPRIRETLQADFGNSWLHAAGWKKTVGALRGNFGQDLNLLRTALNIIYSRSLADFRFRMQTTLAKAATFKHETHAFGKLCIGQVKQYTRHTSAFSTEVVSHLSQAIDERQRAANTQVSLRAAYLQRNISSYISNKVHRGQIFVDALPTAYRIHLKDTQKKALKLWWNTVGLPGERPMRSRAKGKSQNRVSKQGKQYAGV